MSKYFSELIGTFILVFIGTGSIILDSIYFQIGNIGIALFFGITVTFVVYAFQGISGAHINPAVSIAFWVGRELSTKLMIYYIVFQIVGAILASSILFFLIPGAKTMGETLINNQDLNVVFILEFIITFILMFVILHVSDKSRNLEKFTGIAIGGVVMIASLFFGPLSGSSMNPARSIGPAIFGDSSYLWIYIISTILGAVFSVFVYSLFKSETCN